MQRSQYVSEAPSTPLLKEHATLPSHTQPIEFKPTASKGKHKKAITLRAKSTPIPVDKEALDKAQLQWLKTLREGYYHKHTDINALRRKRPKETMPFDTFMRTIGLVHELTMLGVLPLSAPNPARGTKIRNTAIGMFIKRHPGWVGNAAKLYKRVQLHKDSKPVHDALKQLSTYSVGVKTVDRVITRALEGKPFETSAAAVEEEEEEEEEDEDKEESGDWDEEQDQDLDEGSGEEFRVRTHHDFEMGHAGPSHKRRRIGDSDEEFQRDYTAELWVSDDD